jgi:hypothetical protein
MASAEDIFADYLRRIQKQARAKVHGSEREAVIELVRGLDHATFALTLAPNREELLERDSARILMIRGAAPALRPFLEHLKGTGGGIPWGPTHPGRGDWADRFLMQCGLLSHLQRLAAFEKFGLSHAKFVGKKKLILEVQFAGAEEADRAAGSWISELQSRRLQQMEDLAAVTHDDLLARIDQYVGIQSGWGIRYDSDEELLAFYRALAAAWASDCAEAEALPSTAVIGGRPFEAWREVNEAAFGRVLHHIAFATRLQRTYPHLDLRNLLSIYARKDDAAAVWEQSGERPEDVRTIFENLLLDADNVPSWQAKYEIPLPYYIDLGRDFVMLPLFGGLLNAHAGLAWTLRDRYRDEWNSAASGREEVFRSDLRRALPAPRFLVSANGILLKRADGSVLTDIDAIVLDREVGEIGLFQLKWYDAVGYSPDERDSRRRNILEANQWVEKVSAWLESRPLSVALRTLGIPAEDLSAPPLVFVLVRNEIRFTGNENYDSRAAWLRWAELAKALAERKTQNVLSTVWRTYRHDPPRPKHRGRSRATFRFPGLTVELRFS